MMADLERTIADAKRLFLFNLTLVELYTGYSMGEPHRTHTNHRGGTLVIHTDRGLPHPPLPPARPAQHAKPGLPAKPNGTISVGV